jgi:hypothetical protein
LEPFVHTSHNYIIPYVCLELTVATGISILQAFGHRRPGQGFLERHWSFIKE